jgi:hypothetical protein
MRTYQKHAMLSMMSFLFCISLLIPCQALGRERKFPATLPRFTAKSLILLDIAPKLRKSSRPFPAGRENCDAPDAARSGSGGGARDRRPGDDRDRYAPVIDAAAREGLEHHAARREREGRLLYRCAPQHGTTAAAGMLACCHCRGKASSRINYSLFSAGANALERAQWRNGGSNISAGVVKAKE